MIQSAIARAVAGEDLTRELARASMEQILAGEATPAQIGALAVDMVMGILGGRPRAETRLIAPHITERGSCAAPPQH